MITIDNKSIGMINKYDIYIFTLDRGLFIN